MGYPINSSSHNNNAPTTIRCIFHFIEIYYPSLCLATREIPMLPVRVCMLSRKTKLAIQILYLLPNITAPYIIGYSPFNSYVTCYVQLMQCLLALSMRSATQVGYPRLAI